MNRVVKYLKKSIDLSLLYKPLEKFQLHFNRFAYSSFSYNSYMPSELGFIILLCDKSICHVLHYCSKKIKRVVRSVLGAKVQAFADCFDI